jgi:hypothetical protein
MVVDTIAALALIAAWCGNPVAPTSAEKIFARSKVEIQSCRDRMAECMMTQAGPKKDETIIECARKEKLL